MDINQKYAEILKRDLGNDYLKRHGSGNVEEFTDFMDVLDELSIQQLEERLSKLID
jgi:hypothetical protein